MRLTFSLFLYQSSLASDFIFRRHNFYRKEKNLNASVIFFRWDIFCQLTPQCILIRNYSSLLRLRSFFVRNNHQPSGERPDAIELALVIDIGEGFGR